MAVRFKEFLIAEKVSKSENKAALNDPNITFGMEFEFICDRMKDIEPEMNSDLSEMYDKLVREMDSTRDSISDDRDEWISEMRDEYKQEYEGEFQGELDTAEQDLKDVDAELDNLKNELQDLQTELDDAGEDDVDDIQSQIDDKESDIEEKESEYADHENMRDEAQESLDKVGDIEDHELEEWAEEQNMYYDFIERNPYDWPSIPDELMDWWMEVAGEDADNITQSLYDYILYDDESTWNNLSYPEPGYYGDDLPFEEKAEQYFDFEELPSFVRNDYVVSDYHGNVNSKSWRIEDDSSLSEGGVEIVSPVLPIKDAKKVVKEMFDYIDSAGDTDNTCGLHVHLGYTGTNLTDNLDILKVMVFLDEGYITKTFDERSDSGYAMSMHKRLAGSTRKPGNLNGDPDFLSPADMIKYRKRRLKSLFKAFSASFLPTSQKYNAINWQPIDEGHIEIRWMGGSGYQGKYEEVMNSLGKFAAVLKLGLDPEYKKQEYLKRLWRLADVGDDSNDKLQQKADQKLLKKVVQNNKLIAAGLDTNERITVGFYDYKGTAYQVIGTPIDPDARIIKLGKVASVVKQLKKEKFKKIDIRMTNSAYIK